MQLLFASDLHGDLAQYEQLARWARSERPDCWCWGGDLFPHARRQDGPPLAFVDRLGALVGAVGVPVCFIPGNGDWPACARALAAVPRVVALGPAPVQVAGVLLQGYPYVPPAPFPRQDYIRRDLTADRPLLPAGSGSATRPPVPCRRSICWACPASRRIWRRLRQAPCGSSTHRPLAAGWT